MELKFTPKGAEKTIKVLVGVIAFLMAIILVMLLSGCGGTQIPLEKDYTFIIPETSLTLVGPENDVMNWRQSGLWWTNGREQRIYIRGWQWREKGVYPRDY